LQYQQKNLPQRQEVKVSDFADGCGAPLAARVGICGGFWKGERVLCHSCQRVLQLETQREVLVQQKGDFANIYAILKVKYANLLEDVERLTLFCEENGDVVNGGATKEIISKLRAIVDKEKPNG
jgi:hypothetical protein